MEEVLFTAYFGLIWLAINRSKIFKLYGNCEIANYAWGISLLGAVFTFFLYNNVYAIEIAKADTFKFFVDAKTILSFWQTNPLEIIEIFFGTYQLTDEVKLILESTQYWFRPYHYGDFNDNQLIIRINMFLYPFTWGNYYIHLLIFSFLGFIELWLIIKSLFEISQIEKSNWVLILFLIPNVFVWKSGVLKEPILIFGIGVLLFNILKSNKTLLNYILIAFGFFVLLQVKAYVLASLFPVLILIGLNPTKYFILKATIVYSVLILITYLINEVGIVNIPQLIYQKQFDFYNVSETTQANSGFETFRLKPTLASIIINSPMALINGTFRPLPWNCNTPLMWIATLENLITFSALIYSFLRVNNFKKGGVSNLLLLFSVNLLVIVGLTTTVSGALVRYKMPATIALWVVILYNLSKAKNEKHTFLPLFWS